MGSLPRSRAIDSAASPIGETGARTQIEALLRLFELAPVTRPVLEGALALEFHDFEDAVLHECAR